MDVLIVQATPLALNVRAALWWSSSLTQSMANAFNAQRIALSAHLHPMLRVLLESVSNAVLSSTQWMVELHALWTAHVNLANGSTTTIFPVRPALTSASHALKEIKTVLYHVRLAPQIQKSIMSPFSVLTNAIGRGNSIRIRQVSV